MVCISEISVERSPEETPGVKFVQAYTFLDYVCERQTGRLGRQFIFTVVVH